MGETVERAEPPINVRRALAGINLMKGMSAAEALVRAGYSPSTARRPTGNGLDANRCLAEAVKLDPEASPAKLLSSIRAGLRRKLAATKWEDESLMSVAKIVDIGERSYGAGEALDALEEARLAFDRGAFARELARLAVAAATPQQVADSQEADDVITVEDAKSAD